MRKIIYFVAVSADGFIAHVDGSHSGWVLEGDHMRSIGERYPETIPTHVQNALGLPPQRKRFDAVLMGRKTYEVGRQEGITSPYASLKQYVFSGSMMASPDPAVMLVREDAGRFVRQLKEAPGQDIWLCGGGKLASRLIAEGLLDEIVLKHHPVLFGDGISLVAGLGRVCSLDLLEREVFDSGVLLLRYRVRPATGS